MAPVECFLHRPLAELSAARANKCCALVSATGSPSVRVKRKTLKRNFLRMSEGQKAELYERGEAMDNALVVDTWKRKNFTRIVYESFRNARGTSLYIRGTPLKLFYSYSNQDEGKNLPKMDFVPSHECSEGIFISGKDAYLFSPPARNVTHLRLDQAAEFDLLSMPVYSGNNFLGSFVVEGQAGKRLFIHKHAPDDIPFLLKFAASAASKCRSMMEGWFDPLTSLLNSTAFEHEIIPSIRHWLNRDYTFSVLLMDLDNFKLINDTYGYHAGDAGLCLAANRIVRHIRNVCIDLSPTRPDYADFGIRLHGDEFVIVLFNSIGKNSLAVAERLRNQIAEIIYQDIHLSASIGLMDSVYIAKKLESDKEFNFMFGLNHLLRLSKGVKNSISSALG